MSGWWSASRLDGDDAGDREQLPDLVGGQRGGDAAVDDAQALADVSPRAAAARASATTAPSRPRLAHVGAARRRLAA